MVLLTWRNYFDCKGVHYFLNAKVNNEYLVCEAEMYVSNEWRKKLKYNK